MEIVWMLVSRSIAFDTHKRLEYTFARSLARKIHTHPCMHVGSALMFGLGVAIWNFITRNMHMVEEMNTKHINNDEIECQGMVKLSH